MKKIFPTILTGFIVLLTLGCSEDQDLPEDAVLIRILNVSPYKYESVYVNTSGGEKDYGNLMPGKYSGYEVFDQAYRYAYIEVEINGETYKIQPYDYFGETPLENGKYTYAIRAEESGEEFNRLSLSLIEE